MRIFLLITFSWLLLAASVHAQTVTVIDKTTQQSLSLVNLSSPDGKITATTNTAGKAEISNFKAAKEINFSLVGYRTLNLAYTAIDQMNFTVVLTPSSYSLNEVVISASKFDEKREEVPQQIQILNARDLKFMSQATTADVLGQTGNILVQKSQLGGGSPIIRGFEANKVLLVIDGVRMNNAIYRAGHLQNVITLDNAVLDRAEVVFGPGSVVYGSDALGGVMHFYTRNPILATTEKTKNIQVNAFTRYATAAKEKTVHADVNLGYRKIGLLTSFTYTDFSNLRQGKRYNKFNEANGRRTFYVQRVNNQDSVFRNSNPNQLRPSGYRQYDLLQKIKYQPSQSISHLLNIQYSTSSDIPRFDRLTLLRNGKPRFAEWYYGPQERLLAAYTLEKKGTGAFYDNSRLIAAYQHVEESRMDRDLNNISRNNRLEAVGVYSFNWDLEKDTGKNEFRYGVEANHNTVQSSAFKFNVNTTETSPLDTRYPDGGSTMSSVAAYITHAYEASPKFILHDGLRYSQVKLTANFKDKTFFPFPFNDVTQQNGALNGNLGLTFLPGKEWRLAGLISCGFRAPNVDDLSKVFESVPGTVIVPNPNLKSEYTYNTELTIAKGFNQRVRIEGTGYYTWYRQAITTQPGAFNNETQINYNNQLSQVLTNVNAQKAYVYGISGSLVADITSAVSLTSSFNYTFGRIQTDSTDYPLDHIPPVFGRTAINLKLKKFQGEIFAQYNGAKALRHYNLLGEDNFAFATPTGMPAWYTLNLRTAYQVHKHIQLQAALENILDKHYRVFASTISAPGRNFSLTVRGSF
ncbi:MAG: TonB-dependent receptor [Adhaeribacter sp.]